MKHVEKDLEAEIATTKAALAASNNGNGRQKVVQQVVNSPVQGSSSLDNIPIGTAIKLCLESVGGTAPAGEIFNKITTHRVMTARDANALSVGTGESVAVVLYQPRL